MKNIIMMFLMRREPDGPRLIGRLQCERLWSQRRWQDARPPCHQCCHRPMLVDVKNESITNLKADLQKGAKLIVKKK